MHLPTSDTIVARSTAPGEAALAVIRLSGPESLRIARSCLPSPRATPGPRTVSRSRFVDPREGSVLDDVLWYWFAAPRSFTGEEMVEISFHGSPYIVSRALEVLCAHGARLADPGEFTRRAFCNGKLDLAQSEAIIDLIHARGEEAHRVAQARLRGEHGDAVTRLHDRLHDLISLCEAYLNFPEDVMDEMDEARITGELHGTLADVRRLVGRVADRRLLFEGVRVFLAGVPNVGKSSLFNRLLGHERALVSEIPGTTRDYLEVDVVLGGYRFRVFDQAGYRAATGTDAEDLEQRGISLARKLWESADAFLLLRDLTRYPTAEEVQLDRDLPPRPTLLVGNKRDAVSEPPAWFLHEPRPTAQVSCHSGMGLGEIEEWLVETAVRLTRPQGEATLFFDEWQRDALLSCLAAVEEAHSAWERGISIEFISLDLRRGLDALGSITGRTTADDILNRIFERFCIGK